MAKVHKVIFYPVGLAGAQDLSLPLARRLACGTICHVTPQSFSRPMGETRYYWSRTKPARLDFDLWKRSTTERLPTQSGNSLPQTPCSTEDMCFQLWTEFR
jgi:hypothetical protein